MKLKKLIAKDFRSLKDLEINFPDENVIAIIGNNGSGKTAVLDAIHKCLLQVFFSISSNKLSQLKENDKSSEFASINLRFYDYNQEVNSLVDSNNKPSVDFSNYTPNTYSFYTYFASPRNYEDDIEIQDSLIGKDEIYKLAREMGFKTTRFVGKDFRDWFIKETQRENEEIERPKNFEFTLDSLNNIRSAINTFFAHLEDKRIGSILVKTAAPESLDFKEKPKPDVYVTKGNFELRLSQLSAGEKMLIYIVADIAKRLTIYSENKKEALKGVSLVLIDEIDLHLHPSWQKSVAKALSATFPNVQFVITTHSPLILNHLKTESILVLEDGKCTPLSEKYQSFNSYGADLEDILKIVQGTGNLIPKDIQQKLDEINAKLDEGAIEEAKRLIENLKTLTDPNQPELKKAETQIQYKELLKK